MAGALAICVFVITFLGPIFLILSKGRQVKSRYKAELEDVVREAEGILATQGNSRPPSGLDRWTDNRPDD